MKDDGDEVREDEDEKMSLDYVFFFSFLFLGRETGECLAVDVDGSVCTGSERDQAPELDRVIGSDNVGVSRTTKRIRQYPSQRGKRKEE